MSVEAITWAIGLPITHSSAKFVLVVMANCAAADTMEAFPSTKYLSDATGQDRKTVLANLARLRDWGFIEDTGRRCGATKQIVVYRLCYRSEDPTTGRFNDPCCMNRVVPPKRTEKGIVSNSPGIGTVSGGVTVPKTEGNSPKNGVKEYRFSLKQSQKRDTEPSEPSVNKEQQYRQRDNDDRTATRSGRYGRRGTRLPDGWQPSDAVREWARSEFPNVDVATVLPEFTDYWKSVPGHRGCKLDWDATFRNRVRYIAARQRKHHGSHRESAAERVARINAEAELREAGGIIEGDCYVN